MNIDRIRTLAKAGAKNVWMPGKRPSLWEMAFCHHLFTYEWIRFWPAVNKFTDAWGLPEGVRVKSSEAPRIWIRKEKAYSIEEWELYGLFLSDTPEGLKIDLFSTDYADISPEADEEIFLGWVASDSSDVLAWPENFILPLLAKLKEGCSKWNSLAKASTYRKTTGKKWTEQKEEAITTVSGFSLEKIFHLHACRAEGCLENLFGTAQPELMDIEKLLEAASNPMPNQLWYFEHGLNEIRAAQELLQLKPVFEPCMYYDERERFRNCLWRTYWIDRVLRLYENAGEFRRPPVRTLEDLLKESQKPAAS